MNPMNVLSKSIPSLRDNKGMGGGMKEERDEGQERVVQYRIFDDKTQDSFRLPVRGRAGMIAPIA
jgi:hypothetical protein